MHCVKVLLIGYIGKRNMYWNKDSTAFTGLSSVWHVIGSIGLSAVALLDAKSSFSPHDLCA